MPYYSELEIRELREILNVLQRILDEHDAILSKKGANLWQARTHIKMAISFIKRELGYYT